ncbi:MAG TPA: DUF2283 domain-containing protein [Anaerolineae bacterium]|nr:DUF2283 domain-containing protein [Anaerolineae bacterium]
MAQTKTRALRLAYDKGADVLYLAFGAPKEGIDEQVSPGVFVRVDERTRRVVGMTIIDFEKHFSRPLGESLPIDLTKYLATV